jgi:hypothetical protein
MEMRDGNVVGWILAVIALVILAAEGNFGWMAVLVPVSFLLACVMIGPHPEREQVTNAAKSGRLELKK